MKMIETFLITASLLVSGMAFAKQQEVNQSLDVPADGLVHIIVVRGEVAVMGWEKNQVEVRGELDEQVEDFIFETSGDETRIEVRIPRTRGMRYFRDETNLTIRIPRNSRLRVRGVSTEVEVKDVNASVEVGVVSGDISLNGGTDRIIMQTVSGEIKLRDANGRIRLKSVSGDIESYDTTGNSSYGTVSGNIFVDNGGEEMEVESVSGDIEVVRTDFIRIAGHSVSGNIEVRGDMMRGGSIEFDNVSGSIRLRLGGDIDSRFDLETGSGSIRNRLTDDKSKVSKYARDERLRFIMGEGTGEIILSTRSGDITLSN
ncbi:MAG: DUF4097 family beta strand repeat protein [Proteobacteria bacterium]|nr:DUF4097 family beta strand repeat protein [Pseudomonadota bacterium]